MSEATSQPVSPSTREPLHFDLDTVREVAALLRESELGEICIETTDEDAAPSRLLLRRQPVTSASIPFYPTPEEYSSVPEDSVENTALTSQGEVAAETAATANITSTAVGIFRAAKTPINNGDAIKVGQAVACVESMRVPTEIVSTVTGQVVEVRAQDGQGVEYGQVLFVIGEIT